MANDRFDEILRQAREELSPDEQFQLARALSKSASAANGIPGQESLYDALMARGIIGSINDAPPDLGTNPIHLEGFGQND
jgi:hypothetical protein